MSKLLNANAANLFVYLTLGEKLSQFVFDLLDLKKFVTSVLRLYSEQLVKRFETVLKCCCDI